MNALPYGEVKALLSFARHISPATKTNIPFFVASAVALRLLNRYFYFVRRKSCVRTWRFAFYCEGSSLGCQILATSFQHLNHHTSWWYTLQGEGAGGYAMQLVLQIGRFHRFRGRVCLSWVVEHDLLKAWNQSYIRKTMTPAHVLRSICWMKASYGTWNYLHCRLQVKVILLQLAYASHRLGILRLCLRQPCSKRCRFSLRRSSSPSPSPSPSPSRRANRRRRCRRDRRRGRRRAR